MGQPWGLSGPEFLWVYVAVMIIAAAVPYLISKSSGRDPEPGGATRDLGPFQAAYLTGGPDRVAQVAITELASSGALRVTSSGLATVTDREAWAGTETAAVLGIKPGDFPETGTITGGAKRIRQSPGVGKLRQKLESDALIGPAARETLPRTVTIAVVVILLGLGIARLAEGISNGRPTRDLVILLLIALAESLVLLVKFTPRVTRPTAHGAARLDAVPGRAEEAKNSSDAAVLMTGTLLGVAVGGLSAVPEHILRSVLEEAMTGPSGSALGSLFSGWSFGGDDRPWRGGPGGRWGGGGPWGGSNCGGGNSCGGGSNCGGGSSCGGGGGGGGGCGG